MTSLPARQFLPSGFSSVDQDADPAALIQDLDQRSGAPFHLAYKQRAIALLELHEGDRVLDVGCGTGEDVRRMSELVGSSGRAIGIDSSLTMISEAVGRHGGSGPSMAFLAGDVGALPFPDDTFDGCLAIRTFQHLAEPQQGLTEMIRTVRSGGRLVVVDPDHDTAVIDIPDRALARKFLSFRANTIRNGGIARHMPALLVECGLRDVSVIAMTEVRRDYAEVEAASHFEGGSRIAHEMGALTVEEADRLVSEMRAAAEAGRFLYAMTYFLTAGRKA